jgi:hypothetical protein
MRLVPVTLAEAKRFVSANHRHNRAPVSWKFGVGLHDGERLVGVVMAGRCVARRLDADDVIEITRCCTLGDPNACTRLYGAILRAAKALGYRVAYTYTLKSESGSSLRAAGWVVDAEVKAAATWACAARDRVQVDLFGEATRPSEAKVRWKRELNAKGVGNAIGRNAEA